MIPGNGGNHECHRLLSLALGHGRVPLSISGLSGVARRQIPSKAAMMAIGQVERGSGVVCPVGIDGSGQNPTLESGFNRGQPDTPRSLGSTGTGRA